MYEPCMCGADDCRFCRPGNFEAIGRRSVYVGDMTPEERKALREDDDFDRDYEEIMSTRTTGRWPT
jgi:hypothetical protein